MVLRELWAVSQSLVKSAPALATGVKLGGANEEGVGGGMGEGVGEGVGGGMGKGVGEGVVAGIGSGIGAFAGNHDVPGDSCMIWPQGL